MKGPGFCLFTALVMLTAGLGWCALGDMPAALACGGLAVGLIVVGVLLDWPKKG